MFIAKTRANHFDTCICRQHAHACKNNRTCAVCPSTLCPSHRLQNPLISARAGGPRLARGSTACKTCGKSRFRRPAVEKWFIKVLKGEIVGGNGWQHAWKYGRTWSNWMRILQGQIHKTETTWGLAVRHATDKLINCAERPVQSSSWAFPFQGLSWHGNDLKNIPKGSNRLLIIDIYIYTAWLR